MFVALQTWGEFLTFGGFRCLWRSKHGENFSHLEGLGVCGAPNMGRISSVCSYNLLERAQRASSKLNATLAAIAYLRAHDGGDEP